MVILLICALDLSTGEEARATATENTGLAVPSESKAGAILWDYTHGIFLSYSLEGSYSTLRSILEAQGYTFTTTTAGVNNINLSPYRIIVINLGSNWNSAYTAAEADSLAAFVTRGGSVLIQSENTACPNGNLTQVVNRFGMTVGLGNPQECYSSFSVNPIYSSIFAGVTPGNVCTAAPGAVGASAPSELIGWMGSYGAMAGRCVNNQGGVILVSDINLWDNTYITYGSNNDELLVNVFAWLSNPPCKPTYESVEENAAAEKNLSVSPNPAGDFLMVTLPSGLSEAFLYDITGAPALQIRDGKNDLRDLRPGVYLLVAGDRVRRVIKF